MSETVVASADKVLRRRRLRSYRGQASSVWWFIVPAVAVYLFAVVVPSVRGGAFAFTDWDGISPDVNWVGLEQFARIFTDPYGAIAVRNTFVIAIAVTIIQNLLGLLIALGVNSKIKSRTVLRVLFFAPVVITSIAVSFLWQNLYAPDGGINALLEGAGLGQFKQSWLSDPAIGIWSIVIVVVWQNVGYSMVIFLAGLQSVPDEILEAASIDGAGPIRRFWSVVRPMLAPAITINLMLSLIGSLKLFDQVFIITKGGPGGATNTISTLIYQNAFTLQKFGYGAALAVILTIAVAIAAAVQYRLLSRQER